MAARIPFVTADASINLHDGQPRVILVVDDETARTLHSLTATVAGHPGTTCRKDTDAVHGALCRYFGRREDESRFEGNVHARSPR